MATLTPRERQVLEKVVAGRLNKQIAAELGTVEKTIKVHRSRVMQKLHAASLIQLIEIAKLAGISPKHDAWSTGAYLSSPALTRRFGTQHLRHLPHGFHEVLLVEWLRQVGDEASLETSRDILVVDTAADRDGRKLAAGPEPHEPGAYARQQFDAIAVGQAQVANRQVERGSLGHRVAAARLGAQTTKWP